MNFVFLVIFSIILNIIIAVVGFIPSVIVTAFNINTFGIFIGFIISLLGESIGAIVAFYLYRLGLKKISVKVLNKYPKVMEVINSSSRQQGKLVLYFRVFPYMPSGVITYVASVSSMSVVSFVVFSTIGKIPAMIVEVLLTAGFINALKAKNISMILFIISVILITLLILKIIKKGNDDKG